MTALVRARPIVGWGLIVLAVVMAVAGIVDSIVDPSGEQLGWGEAVLGVVLVAGPMMAVGLTLRSADRHRLRVIAVCSGILVALVTFVLVMQLLDPNEIAKDRLVQVVGLIAYLAAFVVSVPAFTSRSPEPAGD